jgi:hypothetical protein
VIAGVVETGEQFIAGDNDSSDKFIAADNDTGEQLSLVTTTLEIVLQQDQTSVINTVYRRCR